MMPFAVRDWDDAYANGANIASGERWPQAWVGPARAFRDALSADGRAELGIAYGAGERNAFDLFRPQWTARGLVVFVHGGFWMRLDRSYWSHLAAGSLAHGFAVAMPSYTLAPQARIGQIVREIGAAVTAAAGMVEGPIHLMGHSAGGHLVSRMACTNSPLGEAVRGRIAHVVSISGVHDLRPMMATKMNQTLGIDEAEAMAESPVLLRPMDGARLTAWVGASERSEFVRQNELIANVWRGLGAATAAYAEPDRHHFNVIDGLADPQHPLTRCLLGA